jgi:hypothetical protein
MSRGKPSKELKLPILGKLWLMLQEGYIASNKICIYKKSTPLTLQAIATLVAHTGDATIPVDEDEALKAGFFSQMRDAKFSDIPKST